ncbi:MAG: YIP1 family protein [Alphaproteobacteria bacterium]|nr:YIP1 family protein [Alphaproteobacteria bacterium]MBU1513883.1 YIP1 family protein [Alphaproteobacteria bacterium]MBU2094472.1 YIP1 family protein [Alphaproteobacteria bacterium]MBU2149802.1 YIP1 family protein [Alphaproteobacteria bacterium]MBU2307273.1 YIP1 family protein [Alphaproteobacteria bacterium]
MLIRPGATWDRIAEAPAEPRALFVRYAVPLAAVPAVCGVFGVLVFGFNIANIGVHMSVVGLILGAAVSYGLTLAAVWALAAFIDLTAPAFGGLRGRGAALNLVAYAATASWIGGLSEIYPSLGIPVGILAGLYSLYALYLGLPKLMGVPEERKLTAFAAVLIAILLLAVGRGMITAKAAEVGGPLSASYVPR